MSKAFTTGYKPDFFFGDSPMTSTQTLHSLLTRLGAVPEGLYPCLLDDGSVDNWEVFSGCLEEQYAIAIL